MREMQNKPTVRYHYKPIRMPKLKTTATKTLTISRAMEGIQQLELSSTVVGKQNGSDTLENRLAVS